MTTCTRCENTGFLNLHQIPDDELTAMADDLVAKVTLWIASQTTPHDVQICDCCGDGTGWYGTPGEHYASDPDGKCDSHAYNGGLCIEKS